MSLNGTARDMLNSYLTVLGNCEIYGPVIDQAIKSTCPIRGVAQVFDNVSIDAFKNLKKPFDKQLEIPFDILVWAVKGDDTRNYSTEKVIEKTGRLSGRL